MTKKRRKKKVIPIDAVRYRKNRLAEGIVSRHRQKYYPLYETYLDIYNYQNLKESILNWNENSQNVNVNITKVCHLLEQIGQRGTDFELQEATDLVITNVLPYLSRPTIYNNNFSKMKNVDEAKELILEKIREEAECDRVIANFKQLNSRYNPIKFFTESLKNRDFTSTIYHFCALMETYQMPFKQRFAVTIENALYSLSHLTQSVPTKAVIENVIDYFLIYSRDGMDIYKFTETVRDAAFKDDFISDSIVNNYTDYILECYETNSARERNVLKEDLDNDIYKLIEEYDTYKQMSGGMKALYEVTMVDKTKSLLMQFKLSPTKLSQEAKELLHSIFWSEKIQTGSFSKATKKVLDTLYYCCGTLDVFSINFIKDIVENVESIIIDLYNVITDEDINWKEILEVWKEHYYCARHDYEYTLDYDKQEKLRVYVGKIEGFIPQLEDLINRKEGNI